MARIEVLEIENFRSLENVVFPDCGHINLIMGRNDTGKTSVLQALQTLSCKEAIAREHMPFGGGVVRVRAKVGEDWLEVRGEDGQTDFYRGDEKSGGDEGWPAPPAVFVPPVVSAKALAGYEQILLGRHKKDILKLLQSSGVFVTDLDRSKDGELMLIGRKGRKRTSASGDGVKKLLLMAAAAFLAENTLLLIDELEAALYPTFIDAIISFLSDRCQDSLLQVFITTHSLDVVDAVCDLRDKRLRRAVAYRLEKDAEEEHIRRFSGIKLKKLRATWALDIR
ncbi:MAG: AAA family ATPase [Christensenellales bacterium]|jgi:hypothetical protein